MNELAHPNPYRMGNSQDLFAHLQRKQVVTKAEMVKYAMDFIGLSKVAARAAVTTILSPRYRSKRGDCRGNMSSRGDLYYMQKLPRPVRFGVREPQKFRLRWRDIVLERRYRKPPVRVKVAQEKQNLATEVKMLRKQLERLSKRTERVNERMVTI